MNNDKIIETIGDIDPEFIKEARPKSRSGLAVRMASLAAALILLAGACIALPKLISGKSPGPGQVEAFVSDLPNGSVPATATPEFEGCLVREPEKRACVSYGDGDDPEWAAALSARKEAGEAVAPMDGFMNKVTTELMKSGDNAVWSPASVYLALAMLAECAGGDTQNEIVALLGANDMEAVRRSAKALLEADNYDDGSVKSSLADSLWLRNSFGFDTETVERLAEIYGASIYWGDPADEEYGKARRDWLDRSANGLFEEPVNGLEMDPTMLMGVCSAAEITGGWEASYKRIHQNSYNHMAFFGVNGKTYPDFIIKETIETGEFYYGENFRAAFDNIGKAGNKILFISPDQGVSLETVLSELELSKIIANKSTGTLKLTAPVLDIEADNDMIPVLRAAGLDDCLSFERADFSGLAKGEEVALTEFRHAARVIMDENGVSAAAYSNGGVGYLAYYQDSMTLRLDHPYAFIILGVSGAPLMMGVVKNVN